MDTFVNDINLTYKYLPSPFKEFNETHGKQIYNEIMYKPTSELDRAKTEEAKKQIESVMILHLSGDVRELVSYIEENKGFLLD